MGISKRLKEILILLSTIGIAASAQVSAAQEVPATTNKS